MLENKYDKFLATVKEQNAGKDWYDIRKKMSAVPALKKAIITFKIGRASCRERV